MPIIAPVKQKNFQVQEQAGVTNYKAEFLTGLMSSPALIRNVAIAGHLHHGKTVVGTNPQYAADERILSLSELLSLSGS